MNKLEKALKKDGWVKILEKKHRRNVYASGHARAFYNKNKKVLEYYVDINNFIKPKKYKIILKFQNS